jgi:protein TonB
VDTTLLVKQKSPKSNLKLQHKRVYELTLAITFVLLIGTFQLAREFSITSASLKQVDLKIEVTDIPVTEQTHRPPPPATPSVPIPTEEESVPEDITIASTEIDLSNIPPPPPPPEEDGRLATFVAYDQPPQIIGGIAELQKHLKYPRMAANARIEGIVFVEVIIGVDGRTENVRIIKAKPPNLGFEESAIEAMLKVQWEPAKQRDKNIRVRVTIPIEFQLFDS